MEAALNEEIQSPCVVTQNQIVIDVNHAFSILTGYEKEELLNKNIKHICHHLLRVNDHNMLFFVSDRLSYCVFIFTKSMEPREIELIIKKEKEHIYLFFHEKAYSRIERKFYVIEKLLADNYVGIGIYSAHDLTLLKANQAYLDVLNSPYNNMEHAIGFRLTDFVPWTLFSKEYKTWVNVINSGKAFYGKEIKGFTGIWKNKYYNNTIIPILEEDQVKYMIAMLEDVTDKVKAREKVYEQKYLIEIQNKQFKAVLDNMQDAIFTFNEEREYVQINKAARRYYDSGLSKVGDPYKLGQYFNLDGTKIDFEDMPVCQVLKGDIVHNRKMQLKNDKGEWYLSVNGTPVYDDEGRFLLGILACRDITKEVRKDKTIIEQNEQLEAIISNMSDGLEMVDDQGNITFLNDAAKTFFYNPNNKRKIGDSLKYNRYYYGINGQEIFYDDLPAKYVLEKGGFKDYKLTIVREDKKLYVSVSGSPIYTQEGRVKAAILCIRDVSEDIKANEIIKAHKDALLQAQNEKNSTLIHAMKMKDEFIASITHEFKTPLAVINAALQTIEGIYKNETSKNVKKHLKKIQLNTFRQIRLVNNMLDIAKFNAGSFKMNKENHDIILISRVITQSVDIYAKQKQIDIQFYSNVESQIIAIDEEKYERILLNLLSNAIKFTPKGKKIQINVICINKKAVISVKDEGIGIPEDKQQTIFERFGQVDSALSRQEEGSGIGLSLVSALVTGMGGTIELKSDEENGSTFIVTFPIRKTQKKKLFDASDLQDSRIMQAVAVEFSDIYLD